MNEHFKRIIDVWCPTYPRRITTRQQWANDAESIATKATGGHINVDNHPHVSVYGFPNGHPKDDEVPVVDTFFLDFDIPSFGEYRSSNPEEAAWYRDMSALLTRVRAVANALLREGRAQYFRAALSGHKGVHLFLDFPAIDLPGATIGQYSSGMKTYLRNLIAYLEEETGIEVDPWLDVDSSDLSKLCRLPNTVHPGATQAFGEDRYCVPVSIKELSEIRPNEYFKITGMPRMVEDGYARFPSKKAHDVLKQFILDANAGNRGPNKTASRDGRSIEEYDEQCNQDIELTDVQFLTSNKPCIWDFHEREDKFNHGAESHTMELNVIAHLVDKQVPVDVILEFFDNVDGFNEGVTLERIQTVLERDYSKFSCETIWRKASAFCIEDDCRIYLSEH